MQAILQAISQLSKLSLRPTPHTSNPSKAQSLFVEDEEQVFLLTELGPVLIELRLVGASSDVAWTFGLVKPNSQQRLFGGFAGIFFEPLFWARNIKTADCFVLSRINVSPNDPSPGSPLARVLRRVG